jgi:hypothetical protein
MRTKAQKREGMHEVLGEFKRGALHSGSKTGPVVKSRAQAIAIGLKQTGQSKYQEGGLVDAIQAAIDQPTTPPSSWNAALGMPEVPPPIVPPRETVQEKTIPRFVAEAAIPHLIGGALDIPGAARSESWKAATGDPSYNPMPGLRAASLANMPAPGVGGPALGTLYIRRAPYDPLRGRYDIVDETGAFRAPMMAYMRRPAGAPWDAPRSDLNVSMIGQFGAGLENAIGPRNIRSWLRAVGAEFPEAQTLSGFRMSGVRSEHPERIQRRLPQITDEQRKLYFQEKERVPPHEPPPEEVYFQQGGLVPQLSAEPHPNAPHPDDAHTLIDVAPDPHPYPPPEPPAYIGTLERLHAARMQAQGIPRQAGGQVGPGQGWAQQGPSFSPPTNPADWQNLMVSGRAGGLGPQPSGNPMPPSTPLQNPLMPGPPQPPRMPDHPAGPPTGGWGGFPPQPAVGPLRGLQNQWPHEGFHYGSGGGLVGIEPLFKHYQKGGLTESSMSALGRQAHYGGMNVASGLKLVHSTTPGRTDRIPIRARPGSFVLPADVVSGLGQGNTLAGAKMWGQAIAHSAGPYGAGTAGVRAAKMPALPRPVMPRSPRGTKAFAEGGENKPWHPSDPGPLPRPVPILQPPFPPATPERGPIYPYGPHKGYQEGGDIDDGLTTILVAGGEMIVDPDYVTGIGDGDLEKGSKLLHENVLHVRKQVGDNRNLPEPVQ